MLRFDRKQQNSVKQLSFKKKKINKKTAGRNNNLGYADDTTLMAESEEELKGLLMRLKEESARIGLKLNIKKKLRSWHLAPILHGK